MTSGFVYGANPSDNYDPDDVVPRDSPLLKPYRPRLERTPSPPPIEFVSMPKARPSQGDAVLVNFLDNGRHLDIARRAGDEPLAADCDGASFDSNLEDLSDSCSSSGRSVDGLNGKLNRYNDGSDDGEEDDNLRPLPPTNTAVLQNLAAGALTALIAPPTEPSKTSVINTAVSRTEDSGSHGERTAIGPENSLNKAGSASVSLTPASKIGVTLPFRSDRDGSDIGITPASPPAPASGREIFTAQGSSNSGSVVPRIPEPVPTNMNTTHSELAPMHHHSVKPQGQVFLPSIHTLDGLQRFPDPATQSLDGEAALTSARHHFVHSSSPRNQLSRQNANKIATGGSPPLSPNELPSPPQSIPSASPNFYPPGTHGRPGADYSVSGNGSGSSATETPRSDQSVHTPATPATAELMTIDSTGGAVPPVFTCPYPGCKVAPFPTQYLLNSHANVHSSSRPYYCSVRGCPRSVGGLGFKRKNEMIRHGLVHDSPGYICPFCPDREHKYPRPDNLQRHVRVHHVDKDKDDPILREVLSQRPDGLNRGRRRRGCTT